MQIDSITGTTRWPVYNEYRDCDDEWGVSIPSHWHCMRNAALFTERSEKGFPELPALSVSLRNGVTLQEYSDDQIDRGADDKSGYKRVLSGELVYNKMRMWQGAVGVAPQDGIVSPAYIICSPRVALDARYFEYLYRTELGTMLSGRYSYGICKDMNSLRFEDFKCIRSIFPPIDEQRAIVGFLDRETLRIDALVQRKEALIDLLHEKCEALVCRAATQGLNPDACFKETGVTWLGKVPSHWRLAHLRYLIDEMQTGPFGSTLHADDYVNDGIPVINPSNLREGLIIADRSCTVDEETYRRLVDYAVSEGDIIIARRGEMGRCSVVTNDEHGWLCGTGSMRIRVNQEYYLPEYARLYLSQYGVRDWLKLQSVGTTMDNLNSTILGGLPMLCPPLDEQRAIHDYCVSLRDQVAVAISANRKQIGLLHEYRSSLISTTVTGKIDVREAIAI